MSTNKSDPSMNTLLPKGVIKRDGTTVLFDTERVRSAITRAGIETEEFGEEEVALLLAQVLKVLRHRFASRLPSVEQIQDIIEQTLISANFFKTARAYIVYREQHTKLRQDHKVILDVVASVNEYLDQVDWR
ncbi:MAG: hypothetical protein LBF76_01015, partial [Holosporales bacterium]|nr:hypothetical protein [Holosporales bacterium]